MGSEGAGRVPGEDARHAVHHREGHALNIRAVPAEHHGIGRGVPHDLARPRTDDGRRREKWRCYGFFPLTVCRDSLRLAR